MATIACAGCGLPRSEAEADKPCPVCEAGVHDLPAESRPVSSASPLDGMPADISQLAAAREVRPHGHRPEIVVGVLCLIFGIAIAVAAQSLVAEPARTETPPTANVPAPVLTPPTATPVDTDSPAIPPAAESEFVGVPEDAPDVPAPMQVPGVKVEPLPDGRKHFVVEVDLPDGHFTFPSSTFYTPGMQIVLKGRVRALSIGYVSGNSLVDASGLVAQKVTINKVERSTVKVNVPNGEVVVSQAITLGSHVEIHAPNSEVSFKSTRSGNSLEKEPRIDSGSQVKVTAKKVSVSGRIAGENTRLELTLDNGGSFKLPALEGSATVEYRKADPGDMPPRIEIGTQGPRTTVRRVN